MILKILLFFRFRYEISGEVYKRDFKDAMWCIFWWDVIEFVCQPRWRMVTLKSVVLKKEITVPAFHKCLRNEKFYHWLCRKLKKQY